MGLIGLYSGRKIKSMAAKGERLTRTQTAKQALKAIETKYKGGIVYNALYYHAGAGKWVRRSKEADKRTTSKVTMRKSVWRSQPHKYDYPGIDNGPDHRAPSKSKLINYSLRNRQQLLKSVAMGENGGKNVKVSVSGQTINIKYTDGPSVDKLIKMSFPGIVKMCKEDIYKAYKITVPSKDFLILVDRSFSPTVLRYISNTGDPTFNLDTKSISRAAFNKIKASPKSKPSYGKLKPEAKGKYRYGSFSRPLWGGFKPSVPFKIVTPLKSDEDPRRGRMPHSVIVTNKVIPKKELEAYELTDIREIKKLREMYDYIESLGIADKHKGHLRRLFNTGYVKTKGDIDKLAKKVMKPKVKLATAMLKPPGTARRGGKGPKPKPTLKTMPTKTTKSLQRLPLSYKKKTQIPKSLAGLKHPIIIRRGKQYYIRKPWGEYIYSDLKAEKARFNDLHRGDRYYMAGMPGIGNFGDLKLVERGKPPRIEYSEYSLAGVKRINIDLRVPKNPIVYRWEDSKDVDLGSRTVNDMINTSKLKQTPKEQRTTPKPTGVTIKELSGAKLKKALGLRRATKRYHNRNKSGGNFAIDLAPITSKTRAGYELSGYHDSDGVIYNLSIGLKYQAGKRSFDKEELKTFDTVTGAIEKVIDATEKSN